VPSVTALVISVAFSPDGSTILTGSGDNTARLWEVTSGQLIHSFEGHSNSVLSVAFSPNGHTILTGSGDNTARLWDRATGRCKALYLTAYPVMAIRWVGSSEIWLADDGGPRHYPYIYKLKLEGDWRGQEG
jgi:WD40 repeat protein